METLDILKGARELLSDPARWCQGWYARTDGGGQVYGDEPEAVRFCLLGACQRASGGDHPSAAFELLRECAPNGSAHMFNDAPATTHADVLRVLDCAIAKAST